MGGLSCRTKGRGIVTLSATSLRIACLCATICVGCSYEKGGTAPSKIPACIQYGTGTLVVANDSKYYEPRHLVVDGKDYGIFDWGSKLTVEVTAGVPHDVQAWDEFYRVVTQAPLTVAECDTYTVWNLN